MKKIVEQLFQLQDVAYKDFQCRLMPNIDRDAVIGVRTPQLRAFAKKIKGSKDAEELISQLPHRYYEENNIHAFLIETIKDYNECINALDLFLPYVDNWATCDMMTPKVLKKDLRALLSKIRVWIRSGHVYTVRYAIKLLMSFYLDDEFDVEYLDIVSSVCSDEYYINMMVAWYFATALAKQYEVTVVYIESKKLSPWVHNKAIQKACESFRITDDRKKYLKTLRINK
ncbi:MAG: DNA alkylation repair protein [Acutalibacteraceae bacterium]|nr:DNA alkylation repair protein [Acutalibacteraceae bacterium]